MVDGRGGANESRIRTANASSDAPRGTSGPFSGPLLRCDTAGKSGERVNRAKATYFVVLSRQTSEAKGISCRYHRVTDIKVVLDIYTYARVCIAATDRCGLPRFLEHLSRASDKGCLSEETVSFVGQGPPMNNENRHKDGDTSLKVPQEAELLFVETGAGRQDSIALIALVICVCLKISGSVCHA